MEKHQVIDNTNRVKNLLSSTEQHGHKARPQFIVDAESGPYKTIQEAVDQAEPGSIIKIAPGLYSDNIIINKPNLILEPKEKVGDIIMVVQSKPAITINLKKGEKCTIIGMKLSHSGNTEDVEKIEKMMEDKKFAISLFNNEDDKQEGQSPFAKLTPEMELINKFPIDPNMNCILLASGGTIIMEECLLSLNFIVNNYKNILPAIVIHNGADFSMNKVEVKGNKNHETVGVMIKKSDAIIKECKIHSHLMGGILIWAKKKNKVDVVNCKVVFNSKAGIHVIGQDSNCLIEGNKIEHNAGAGIKIGIANKSSIIRNEIRLNQNGIEVISADPFIFSNKIDKNFENGVYTYSYKDQRCDGRIKTNLSISGNTQCGICCVGNNNFTKIEQNSFIGYNKKAGIKADENAKIFIHKNKITKNLGQGILLVESSSATIEKNEITDNIKANIALGGHNSINTLIVENKISGGRCEGIFVIEGGQCWIMRNTIQENNDGIVIMKSVPEVNRNTIIKNKSNGIMLLNYSSPKIFDNLIADNDGIGLFIREKCIGTFKNNVIKSNEIELVVEKRSKNLEDILKTNNVTGDIRIPQNMECNIF